MILLNSVWTSRRNLAPGIEGVTPESFLDFDIRRFYQGDLALATRRLAVTWGEGKTLTVLVERGRMSVK